LRISASFGPTRGRSRRKTSSPRRSSKSSSRSRGQNLVLAGKWLRKDGEWHHDPTAVGKETIVQFVADRATAADVTKWVSLLELVRQRLELA
jgi:hypothetical protein